MKKLLAIAALAGIAGIGVAAPASARDQLHIVGSSTVFPFSIAVAEEFAMTTGFSTPVVESTGSGGGLKLFCAGGGIDTPDITNASRRIKMSEVETCAKNGVGDIVEIKVGFDGIVIANSKSAPPMNLTLQQLFLALAKDVPAGEGSLQPNPHQKWSDIDPALPDTKIEVFGPPPTSGTRDSFNELAIEGGCKTFKWLKEMKEQDKARYKEICRSIREDGAYIEAGENDNLIVQKLSSNPTAFGVFGYSFLDQNRDTLQGSLVNGTAPEIDAITSGKYPISRTMFFYIKKSHVGVVPGIQEYAELFTRESTFGEGGFLEDLGLIPSPASDRIVTRNAAMTLEAFDPSVLEKK